MKAATPIEPLVVAVRAAQSAFNAKTFVATDELIALARHCLAQHEALSCIADACRDAVALEGTIDPSSVLAFFADNPLFVQHQTEETQQ